MNGVFRDTEEMSQALKHTNVSAMQISGGPFEAELSTLALPNWTIHFIDFRQGASVCAGDAPRDRHAVVVPLQIAPRSRLLGQPLTDDAIGLYAPGSEHADVTYAGQRIAVLFPNDPSLLKTLLDAAELPSAGSRLLHIAKQERLACLRSTLARLADFARAPDASGADGHLADRVSCTLSSALEVSSAAEDRQTGRPRLSRTDILRRVFDVLDERADETIHAGQLARAVDVSPASLQRVFLEWFGVPPARYLASRRYYDARRRLRDGSARSVTDVACDLGFGDLSRFSMSYRRIFHEPPSDTLRKARV